MIGRNFLEKKQRKKIYIIKYRFKNLIHKKNKLSWLISLSLKLVQ